MVWWVRNGEVVRVGNMSQEWSRAVVDVGVAYDSDIARVREVLAEVLATPVSPELVPPEQGGAIAAQIMRGGPFELVELGAGDGSKICHLIDALHAAGAEIHYIFMPTSPIQGNNVYWTEIAQGAGGVQAGPLAFFDTTMLANDAYDVLDWDTNIPYDPITRNSADRPPTNDGWNTANEWQDPRTIRLGVRLSF